MVPLNDDVREHGITIDQAIEILGWASSGSTTHDDKFKAACKWGQRLLVELKYERIKGFERR